MEPGEPEVAAYIGRREPSSVQPQAAVSARAVAERAGPRDRKRANALLWSAARLADFAMSLGPDLVPEIVVLHPSVIERLALAAPVVTDPARRTLRTNQRFIARRVVPQLHSPGKHETHTNSAATTREQNVRPAGQIG